MASEIRVNKIENRSGLGTVTFADTGVDLAGIVTATTFSGSGASLTSLPAAQVTGTLPAISGANLTNLPAANLTGALPAISGANLTGMASTDNVRTGILDVAGISTFRNTMNVGAAVTISESGIEASGIGITVANINGGQLSHRNKIINGSQSIFQRGTSETRSGGNDGYYNGLGDRWAIRMHSSVAQTTFSKDTSDNPDGFGSNQKLVRANAGSSNAAKYFVYDTKLEGQDLQDFAKGTSSAKEFTLSFYVKTGVSGVYCVEMRDLDNARMVGGTYTVSNSNWNRYVITFPADTTGKFDNDNGGSLWVRFWLAAGSSFTSGTARTTWGSFSGSDIAVGQTAQVGDNVADTWQITGVQLEVGSQATAFEHRSHAEELSLCQRYFQILKGGFNVAGSTSIMVFSAPLYCVMRATPSAGKINISGNNSTFEFGDMISIADHSTATPTFDGGYIHQDLMVTGNITGFDNLTAYRSYKHEPNATNGALITADAEL